jgi:hypothetical protein
MVGIVARKAGKTKGLAKSAAFPKVRKESGLLGFPRAAMLLKGQSFQAFHLVGKVRFTAAGRKIRQSRPRLRQTT